MKTFWRDLYMAFAFPEESLFKTMEICNAERNRYKVFSLWTHQLSLFLLIKFLKIPL